MKIKVKEDERHIKITCTHREAMLLRLGIVTIFGLGITDAMAEILNCRLFDSQELKSGAEMRKVAEVIYTDLADTLDKIEVY